MCRVIVGYLRCGTVDRGGRGHFRVDLLLFSQIKEIKTRSYELISMVSVATELLYCSAQTVSGFLGYPCSSIYQETIFCLFFELAIEEARNVATFTIGQYIRSLDGEKSTITITWRMP